jgi:hypothetical protein
VTRDIGEVEPVRLGRNQKLLPQISIGDRFPTAPTGSGLARSIEPLRLGLVEDRLPQAVFVAPTLAFEVGGAIGFTLLLGPGACPVHAAVLDPVVRLAGKLQLPIERLRLTVSPS